MAPKMVVEIGDDGEFLEEDDSAAPTVSKPAENAPQLRDAPQHGGIGKLLMHTAEEIARSPVFFCCCFCLSCRFLMPEIGARLSPSLTSHDYRDRAQLHPVAGARLLGILTAVAAW